MTHVVVYPSGFVGYDVGLPRVRTEENFDAANALSRFSSVSTREKLSISNTTIEGLFKQWRTHTRRTSDPQFLSDIFAAVANAFGTTSFYEWCHMQLANPYFTADHREYLNESLHFIYGRERKYSYPTWAKILTIRHATPEDKLEPYDYQQVLVSGGMERTSVLNVMERWISQTHGVDDMLTFAHLVFGDAF